MISAAESVHASAVYAFVFVSVSERKSENGGILGCRGRGRGSIEKKSVGWVCLSACLFASSVLSPVQQS